MSRWRLLVVVGLGVLASVARAFLPALRREPATAPRGGGPTTLQGAKEELVALAEANPDALGQKLGFWDPLGATNLDFWNLGTEGTIGYLRHAEIKHGRVAMAGFLGYCVQSLPIVSGEHLLAPYPGYVAGVTPQEQWDNIP